MPVLVVLFGAADAIRGSLGVGAAALGVHLLSFERDLCPRSSPLPRVGAGLPIGPGCLQPRRERTRRRAQFPDGHRRHDAASLVEQPFVFVSKTLPLVGEVLTFVRELLTLVREPLTFVGGGVPQVRTVRACTCFRRPR